MLSLNIRDVMDIDDNLLKKIDENEKKVKIKKRPWVDKYRPATIDEVVHQEAAVAMFRKTLASGELPHLLLFGPPGTGKTSTILATAMQLFGPKKYKERVMELNASDERGINIVRKKIINFSKTAVGTADPNYPCPPYKIIILDEADAMTTEAQAALRRAVEENSKITRFCFICNYVNKIVDEIKSRCVKFRFKPLSTKAMYTKLKYIAENEKMNIAKDIIDAIIKLSDGDMRKGIMLLQNLKYIQSYQDKIDVHTVYELANRVPEDIIEQINQSCVVRNRSVKHIMGLTQKIKSYGYPIDNVVAQIHELVVESEFLSDKAKAVICMEFGRVETRLIEGADEYLQLMNILMCISENNKK